MDLRGRTAWRTAAAAAGAAVLVGALLVAGIVQAGASGDATALDRNADAILYAVWELAGVA